METLATLTGLYSGFRSLTSTPLVTPSYMEETRSANTTNIQFDKIVESVSTAAMIALLSFEKVGTKIRIKDNRIVLDEPSLYQGFNRMGVATKDELRSHNILYAAVIVPQTWYPLGSAERNAIIRIHEIAKKGLLKLKKTYIKHDLLLEYIDLHIKEIEKFKELESDDRGRLEEPISNIMKSIWTTNKLNNLVELLNDVSLKESNQEERIKEVLSFIEFRTKDFQRALQKDQKIRYKSVKKEEEGIEEPLQTVV